MSRVNFSKISKSFGAVSAVQNLDLEISQGEFFSLLGPSGCGKTTTLRMAAGFEFPTSGAIHFDDRNVTFEKPNRRNTGMVFQNFALFPHMTVFENVAFGMRARKVAKPEIGKRVENALHLVDLAGLAERSVTQLSGGQQQRVALARAIVIEPAILLLDEPLSNLDAKLREEMRSEIKSLQRRLGITTIYVTHDQDEALSLSDRIAVMKTGICQQVGRADEVYQKPANAFVAEFVGKSNVLPGQVISQNGKLLVQIAPEWHLELQDSKQTTHENISVSLRPEHIELQTEGDSQSGNLFTGRLEYLQYNGALMELRFDIFGFKLNVKRLATLQLRQLAPGSLVPLSIKPANIYILPDSP